jgi:hypothetical protein
LKVNPIGYAALHRSTLGMPLSAGLTGGATLLTQSHQPAEWKWMINGVTAEADFWRRELYRLGLFCPRCSSQVTLHLIAQRRRFQMTD